MSIAISSSSGSQQLWQILASASQTSTSETSTQSLSVSTDSSVDLSDPGKLFSELGALAESDPEKFKTVMEDISEELEKAAESATDDHESEMLKKAAESFASAAESGELSDAMPQGPPPGPPPADMSTDSAVAEQISAYTQNAGSGSGGFDTVLSIISEVLDKSAVS